MFWIIANLQDSLVKWNDGTRTGNDSRCGPRSQGVTDRSENDEWFLRNRAIRRWRSRRRTLPEELKGPGCCVCVTVPHRALTAPRRVASLKSRLAPTCLTRSNGDWPLLPATAAIGTPTELSENFPRYIVRFISPTSTCSHWASRGEKSGICQIKGREKLSKEKRYSGWIQKNFLPQN